MTHDCGALDPGDFDRVELVTFAGAWILRTTVVVEYNRIEMVRVIFCPWCGEKLGADDGHR